MTQTEVEPTALNDMVRSAAQPLVIVESPYGSQERRTIYRNILYARACMADALSRGEAAYASHLLYTQVWNDLDERERNLGIEAGHRFLLPASYLAFYDDFGFSSGMLSAHAKAIALGKPFEVRKLGLDVARAINEKVAALSDEELVDACLP